MGIQERLYNLGRKTFWKAVIWKTINEVGFAEVG
jgi:hypothetical protein